MRLVALYLWIAAVLAGGAALAAEPPLGTASSKDGFLLDNIPVKGSAVVLNGSLVATAASGLRLDLNGGTQITLGGNSRARVYRSRVVLERGTARLSCARQVHMEAAGLRVMPGPQAIASVQVADNGAIVAAQSAAVPVADRTGTVIASIAPGRAMKLSGQAAK